MRFLFVILMSTAAIFAQAKKNRPPDVQLKDFQSNVTQEGRRTFIKGEDSKPVGDGLLWLKKPHLETFKADGKPDTIIDAAEATVDQGNTRDIWSDKELSMRSVDGSKSIQGVGFRWSTSNSQLSISNNVSAILRRGTFISGSTNKTDSEIKISADQLHYTTELVVFNGHVHVVDAQGEVRCQTLKVRFEGSVPTEIEAIDDVLLSQGKTQAGGKRALYSQVSGLLRLSEKTRWSMEGREGQSDLLILDRTNQTVRAEGNLRMTMPSSLLATNAASTNIASATQKTNRVTITADSFDYAATNTVTRGPVAVFNGNVHATDPQANLDAELLTIFFNQTNKLVRAIAERSVVISRPGTRVNGDRAVFENEEVAVTGKPTWQYENKSGQSDLLVFNPQTQEIRAINVRMELPHTGETTFFGVTNKPTAKKSSVTTTNILLVTAMYFTNRNNVASFSQNVRAADRQGQIDANHVDVSYGSSNRLERIRAQGDVILTENQTQAIGQEAVFDAETGQGRLTGNPKIFQEGREIIAREFTLNRVTGEFRPVAPFRAILRRNQSRDNSSATNLTNSPK